MFSARETCCTLRWGKPFYSLKEDQWVVKCICFELLILFNENTKMMKVVFSYLIYIITAVSVQHLLSAFQIKLQLSHMVDQTYPATI